MGFFRNILFLIFGVSLLGYFWDIPFYGWLILTYIFAIFSLLNFFDRFRYTLPYGEFIAFIFLIENALSVSIIYFLDNKNIEDIGRYYMQIPLNNYLPYGLMAVQAFLLGNTIIKRPDKIWINYINNLSSLINRKTIIYIFSLSIISFFLRFIHLDSIGFVCAILEDLGLCALLGLYLYGKGKENNIYIIFGIIINIISAINTGMFTGLANFIIMIGIIYLTKTRNKNGKLNWFVITLILFVGVIVMAFMQNLKWEYREKAWSGSGNQQNSANFSSSFNNNFQKVDILNKDYYLPILYRTNQAWLVSCTMEKVPIGQPFVYGETVISSFLDALLPRVLNPDKQQAGGVTRIKKFTYLILMGTSMGIGYLGESYVNFGIIGGIIFMGLLGVLFGFLEKKALILSKKYPLILLAFPYYVMALMSSANDFFWMFNNLIMGSLIIFIIIKYFTEINKKYLKEEIINKTIKKV